VGVEHVVIRNGTEPSWEYLTAAACREYPGLSDQEVADVVCQMRDVPLTARGWRVRRVVLALVREERARG
jgi:hypothetical protein